MNDHASINTRAAVTLGPYDAVLFDMDGTILTSIAATERAWSLWAQRAGLPAADIIAYMHGRRAVDTIAHFLPGIPNLDEEVAWLDNRELEDLEGIAEIPGAGGFLRALPRDRWAVVTSANRLLASRRIEAAGLPKPPVLVSSDEVNKGKPNPEGYARAMQILGVRPAHCLVFEDTLAGIKAGSSAGADVVRVAGMHLSERVPVKATIDDYRTLSIDVVGSAINLTFGQRQS